MKESAKEAGSTQLSMIEQLEKKRTEHQEVLTSHHFQFTPFRVLLKVTSCHNIWKLFRTVPIYPHFEQRVVNVY